MLELQVVLMDKFMLRGINFEYKKKKKKKKKINNLKKKKNLLKFK